MSKIQFKPGENIHTEPMVPFEFRQVKGVDVSTILIASSGDIDLISWAWNILFQSARVRKNYDAQALHYSAVNSTTADTFIS